jgi:hypothetical protein
MTELLVPQERKDIDVACVHTEYHQAARSGLNECFGLLSSSEDHANSHSEASAQLRGTSVALIDVCPQATRNARKPTGSLTDA